VTRPLVPDKIRAGTRGAVVPGRRPPREGAMIRAIICDDHPIVREGVRLVLNDTKDILLEDEATNGHELLEKIRRRSFDVIILDLSYPEGPDGLEVLRAIRAERPGSAVLVLSMHTEEHSAVRALRDGADGYVVKGSRTAELLEAIRKVAAGGKYVSPALAERLATEMGRTRGKPAHELLSDQEYRVLCRLAAGRGISAAARELGLSPSTVGTYRSRIMDKLGLKNNAEMIRYALKNGLVE
jgi:two-component system, NarL family, invasion response regulator UvrY